MNSEQLEQGWELHQRGALDAAGEIYAQVLASTPTNVRCLFLFGALEMQRGKIEDAYRHLQAAANIDPDDLDVLNTIGIAARRSGRLDDAVKYLSHAANLAPDDAVILLNYGVALKEIDDLPGAIAAYRKAIEQSPNMAEGHNNLGNALAANGETRAALPHYQQAIQINPQFADAHQNLGTAARRLGDNDLAIAHLVQAVELSQSPKALCELADIQLATDQLDQAEENFSRAAEADPTSAVAQFGAALALLRKEMPEPALDRLRKATQLDPDHFGAWFNLGTVLWNENRNLEAMGPLSEALRLDPRNEIARHLMSAARGETPDTAPDQYVAELFNEYSGRFEQHLVETLQYEVPWIMRQMYDKATGKDAAPLKRALDLGCGTGLIGRTFEDAVEAIDGVDLADKMVEKARESGYYDDLRAGELVATLQDLSAQGRHYDLITAGDVFVYVGRLDETFSLVKKVIEPGGWFFFSIESSDESDVILRRSGRYAQSDSYIRELAEEHGFSVDVAEPVAVRLEFTKPINGFVYQLRAD